MKRQIALLLLACTALGASAQWRYESKTSPMSDTPERRATLKSENAFAFASPYQGGTSEWLYLRRDADGLDFALGINRGQFVHSDDVAIRFDKGDVLTFPLGEPADGTSRLAFIHFPGRVKGCAQDCDISRDDFLRRLLAARHATIQATYYQEGQKAYEFKTLGLVWAE